MPGPDDDVDSWPWWLKIKGQPGVLDRVRISDRAQVALSAIVSAITVETIARMAGTGGEGLAKASKATLDEYGEWICGNDLLWLLRLRRKFKDLIPIPKPWPLPDPPPPWSDLAQNPAFEVIGELASLRASLPAKSGLGLGVERFLDGVAGRMDAAATHG